jgi:hypothetical protein
MPIRPVKAFKLPPSLNKLLGTLTRRPIERRVCVIPNPRLRTVNASHDVDQMLERGHTLVAVDLAFP